jgi:hypothetical protein
MTAKTEPSWLSGQQCMRSVGGRQIPTARRDGANRSAAIGK